jgi:DNA polymerase III epsilon subunit-like protein
MEYTHVYIDTETTGLNPDKGDEIVEVFAQEFNLEGDIGESIHFFCRPMSGVIPEGAFAVHGITYDMVKDNETFFPSIHSCVINFVGKRTLVGHNIIDFDIKFLKIKPVAIDDSLLLARSLFPGTKNNLKFFCEKVGLKFDTSKAHGAKYDCEMGALAYIKAKKMLNDRNAPKINLPLFEHQKAFLNKYSVLSENDIAKINNQNWSYSRLMLYHECPFKWMMSYLRGQKEPQRSYFQIGSACHEIAEKSGKWCYATLFARKAIAYCEKNGIKICDDFKDLFYNKNLRDKIFGKFNIETHSYEGAGVLDLMMTFNSDSLQYETPVKPDPEVYDKIVTQALVQYSIVEEKDIKSVRTTMDWFFRKSNFVYMDTGIMQMEKAIAFDRDWNILKNFNDPKVWFRMKVDIIQYDPASKTIHLIDYKTSFTCLTDEEIANNIQLNLYALGIYKFMPPNSIDKIVVEMQYLRFNVSAYFEIEKADIETYIKRGEDWIIETEKLIKAEAGKNNGTGFSPKRNENCKTCYLAEDGFCPEYNHSLIPNFITISDEKELVNVWRGITSVLAKVKEQEKAVKLYIKNSCQNVTIDDMAVGFYEQKRINVNIRELMIYLNNRYNINVSQITPYLSITKMNYEKLLKELNVEISEDKKDNIVSYKIGTTFKEKAIGKELEEIYDHQSLVSIF